MLNIIGGYNHLSIVCSFLMLLPYRSLTSKCLVRDEVMHTIV